MDQWSIVTNSRSVPVTQRGRQSGQPPPFVQVDSHMHPIKKREGYILLGTQERWGSATTGSLLQRSGLSTRLLAQKGGKQNARPLLCRAKLLSLSICYHLSDIYTSTRSASQVYGGEWFFIPQSQKRERYGLKIMSVVDMKGGKAVAINTISCWVIVALFSANSWKPN